MQNKRLKTILPKKSGRDAQGHISIRHQGGRQKRYYREIDWKRTKDGVVGKIMTIEYDPNRSSQIALVHYADGDKRYILAPVGLKIGATIVSGEQADIKVGNAMPIGSMPVGTMIHNLEIKPGRGAQMIRSAGGVAMILSKEGDTVQIKLPSSEVRLFKAICRATIGQLGNVEWKNRVIGKAGRARLMGIRPTVRGVAQHPGSHPHGGGEGRSGIGMPSPKTPWGKPTLGKKTRKPTKYSDSLIMERKKKRK